MASPVLAFLLLSSSGHARPSAVVDVVQLTPTDDVWVYSHAGDPAADEYLRIWGAEGKAAPTSPEEAEELSMGYMKWNLSSLPTGKKLVKAVLTVTNIENPGYSLEQAKAAPLQVRALVGAFDEKTWDYAKLAGILPDKDDAAVYGSGFPSALPKDQTIAIDIDLLKGPKDFAAALQAAMDSASKQLTVALTSKLDMASIGRTGMYKIFSRNSKTPNTQPKLTLTFE